VVTREPATAPLDLGDLAAPRIRAACGGSPVEVPITSDNACLLRVYRHIPKFRRDAKARLFIRRTAGAITSNYVRSTTQFVCIGSFQARISDPLIGGTYITVCTALFFALSLY
jgi:hypothetical protein